VGDAAPPEDAIERPGLTLEGSIARRADLPSSSLDTWRIPDTWRILTRSDIYKRGPSAVSEDRIGAFDREGGDTRHLEKRRGGNKVPKCERPWSVQHALGSGKQGCRFSRYRNNRQIVRAAKTQMGLSPHKRPIE
jgi:hypothetical protein